METKLNDQTPRTAPPSVTAALDASTHDIAAGAVTDATAVQAEMRRMLTDYERAHPPAGQPAAPAKRATTA